MFITDLFFWPLEANLNHMSSREIMETVVTAFLNITLISLVCQSIQDMQKKRKKPRNYISDKANCLQKKNF